MNKQQLEALDAMIGETLASVPTHQEYIDMILAAEGTAIAEVDEDERLGFITHDEHEVIIRAFHQRLHPDGS